MRPRTLCQAYERISSGTARELAFAGFLDTFYGLAEPAARSLALAQEPVLTGDERLDALAGATAEYLAKQYGADVPAWTRGPQRFLSQPWFTTEQPGPGVVEYLVHVSPAEFRSRGIYTEGQPFRRASQNGRRRG